MKVEDTTISQIQNQNIGEQKPLQAPAQQQASGLSVSKLIKLMLIRIGDEKREMIDSHLNVLKNKICSQTQWDSETDQTLKQTLLTVIHNLPHKVFIYSGLISLISIENAQLADQLVQHVVQDLLLNQIIKQQDAFKSRNTFKFLSYLAEQGIICPKAIFVFLNDILNAIKNNKLEQETILLESVITFLAFSLNFQKKQITNENKSSSDALNEILESIMQNRLTKKVKIFSNLLGINGSNEERIDSLQYLYELQKQLRSSQSNDLQVRQLYLMLSVEKQSLIIQQIKSPIVVNLPSLSQILLNQSVDIQSNKSLNLENHLNKNLPVKKYFPLYLIGFDSIQQTLENTEAQMMKFLLISLITDVIFAFQQKSQLVVDNLLGLYQSEIVQKDQLLVPTIVQSILSYILNITDEDFDSFQSQSQSTPKPIVFYVHILNLLNESLKQKDQSLSQSLINLINEQICDIIVKYEFNASGRGQFFQNLSYFHIMLASQHNNKESNKRQQEQSIQQKIINSFLQSLKLKILNQEQQIEAQANLQKLKFNKFVNLYLSISCQLGYYKNVQEYLDEEFHVFIPNQDLLKPRFKFVVGNRERRREASQSSRENDAMSGEQGSTVTVNEEVENIMEVLSQKGIDISKQLTDLFNDETRIVSKELKLKQIFIEVIFTKYGLHSIEHIEKGIEKVKPILQVFFKDQKESQEVILNSLFQAFNMDQLLIQNFSSDVQNLFQQRQKIIGIVEKLCSLEILDRSITIKWCIDNLRNYLLSENSEKKLDLDFIHCQLVMNLIKQSQQNKNNLIPIFIQKTEKVGEIKVETPYEQRQRELRENQQAENNAIQDVQQNKTDEQIREERQNLFEEFKSKYQQSLNEERELVFNSLSWLDEDPSNILQELRSKVLLLSSAFKFQTQISFAQEITSKKQFSQQFLQEIEFLI